MSIRNWVTALCAATVVTGALVAPNAAVAAAKSAAKESSSAAQGRVARETAVLETEIARLAQAADGEVGVLARHLESGLTVSMNAKDAFPMASTFKVAVAGAVLAKVDKGQLTLDQMITVAPKHLLSSEGITEIFPFPGVALSVHNLIESMLTRSDNTATNVLTELAGGPAAVTAWVKAQGVEGLRIDGDTNDIVGRFFGVSTANGSVEEQLKRAIAANPALEKLGDGPNPAFDNDPRDTATPESMALLLSKIVEGHTLSASSTDVLLGSMERCITGLKRLRGLLPAGTNVKDKTGTIGGTVNDVGIITLPNGRGRVVIAVYIKKSRKTMEEREHVIAEIARSVYDYMLIASANR